MHMFITKHRKKKRLATSIPTNFYKSNLRRFQSGAPSIQAQKNAPTVNCLSTHANLEQVKRFTVLCKDLYEESEEAGIDCTVR